MIRKIKKSIIALADQFGYEIRRKPVAPSVRELTHFESCLHLLANFRETLNIVQVGANDGAINDPLYGFISNYPKRTQIILCEPQAYLIPELEKNYEFHSGKFIFNGAIGPDPSLKLYRIKRECWPDCSAAYAQGWPEYRAPTGVTSSSYDHVLTWASNHYKGKLPPGDIIEDVSVDCVNMRDLLRRAGMFDSIDVLQIDAEGFDDQVIYASDIERFLPPVINFEYRNLPPQRAKELSKYLAGHGYVLSPHGIDGLAIHTSPKNKKTATKTDI